MALSLLSATTRPLLSRAILKSSTASLTSNLDHVLQRITQQQQKSNNKLVLRCFRTTSCRRSLDEFFDDPKNYGELAVRSGRAWRLDELRLKSNSDLHKLWFVLYKERNMLYTMHEACKEECEVFPSPERIDKVEESMANLENVVRERNNAYWQLEVSPCATGERPSAFRRDVFGRPRWHKCSQRLVPYHKNWPFRNSQGPGRRNETEVFFNHYREMRRKLYNYERSKTARYLRDLFRRFPNADVDYIAESHPEFPAGYVKHLRDNHLLYNDPPRKSVSFSRITYPEKMERGEGQAKRLLE